MTPPTPKPKMKHIMKKVHTVLRLTYCATESFIDATAVLCFGLIQKS